MTELQETIVKNIKNVKTIEAFNQLDTLKELLITNFSDDLNNENYDMCFTNEVFNQLVKMSYNEIEEILFNINPNDLIEKIARPLEAKNGYKMYLNAKKSYSYLTYSQLKGL